MHKLISILIPLATGLISGWFAHALYNSGSVQQNASSSYSTPHTEQPATGTITLTNISNQPTDLLDSITLLLQRNAYMKVIERYESLQASSDHSLIQQARTRILEHAQQQLKARNFVAAMQLLQGFLVASYRDSDARMLLADTYLGQEDYLTAIEQLYELRGIAFKPEMLSRIKQRIQQVVYKQAELYQKNGDNSGLLALFQNLTQKEPDHASWFIELAIAQLALDDTEAAKYSLALVLSDPYVGEQAQVMLAKLQPQTSTDQSTDTMSQITDIAGIPLSRMGQSFLVEASSGTTNNLKLLIDTGASITIVTPEVLQQQGMHYQATGNTRVFNTANGPVSAPIYMLDSLTVGDWQVEHVEVGVLELKGMDGLLGMNFLKHFRFFIDQHASMLRLSLN